MPVIDHAIHPSTQIGDDYRHGCWNLPRPVYGQTVTGSEHYGSQEWGYVFSTECRNDVSLTDPFCRGCEHAGSGEAYDQEVRKNGN